HRRAVLKTTRLPLPAVAVGNLSVGGTGKTPLAAWIARRYAGRGRVPGILLRGYGGGAPLVHRRLAPDAVGVAEPNRVAGAGRARAAGADILVLDDAFQLLSVARDLNIAVVSAESIAGSPWPLPAGPWRERWDALAGADGIVVTRKRVPAAVADRLADGLAQPRPVAEGHPRAPGRGACCPVGTQWRGAGAGSGCRASPIPTLKPELGETLP